MKNIALIQARLGSQRLAGKILMSLHGKQLLEWVINSAFQITGIENVIVATTKEPADEKIVELAGHLGASVYHGDSENVLSRFSDAAKLYEAENIVRICADSPLIAADYTSKMLEQHITEAADITYNGSQPFPLGAACEIISAKALHTANQEATEAYQRVHVTPFIHEQPKRFKILATKAPKNLMIDARMTIDEEHDLNMFASLFGAAEASGLEITLENCLKLLQERQDIKEINSAVRQRGWQEL